MATRVTREDLANLKGMTPKLLAALENLFVDARQNTETLEGTVSATTSLQAATVLTLSSNAAFDNERVLTPDPASFTLTDDGAGSAARLALKYPIETNGGFRLTLNLAGDTDIDLPTSGLLATQGTTSGPFADDTAAAAGGVAVGQTYRKPAGVLAWRQV